MEDEFYTHVTLEEVATELNMKPQYCELFYNYWKLKRKVDYPRPICCVVIILGVYVINLE